MKLEPAWATDWMGCRLELACIGEDAALDEAAASGLLATGERERAQAFVFARDRGRWVRCRAWLRQVLAEAVGQAPERLTFHTGPRGRPFLPGGPDFNLTHSGDWAALIIGGLEPGIDAELCARPDGALELAETWFLPAETTDIRAAGTAAWPRFLRYWTAKEAVMKSTGLGMALEPSRIAVDLTARTARRRDTGDVFRLGAWEPVPGVLLTAALPAGRNSAD